MGIGVWELLLLLLIVLLLFGTKRLRNIGGDLGSAIRSFRSAVNASDHASTQGEEKPQGDQPEAAPENKEAGH